MIITERKSIDEILSYIKDYTKILLIGCGACATACKTGGQEQLDEFSVILAAEGKKVVGTFIPPEACHVIFYKKYMREASELVNEADAIVVLACGSGVQAIAKVIEKPSFPALNTKFLGTILRAGDYVQYCALCGECVLGYTGGLCPVARCAKGLSQGPCSGSHDGMCEVNPHLECVWCKVLGDLTPEQYEKFSEAWSARDYRGENRAQYLNLNAKKKEDGREDGKENDKKDKKKKQ